MSKVFPRNQPNGDGLTDMRDVKYLHIALFQVAAARVSGVVSTEVRGVYAWMSMPGCPDLVKGRCATTTSELAAVGVPSSRADPRRALGRCQAWSSGAAQPTVGSTNEARWRGGLRG